MKIKILVSLCALALIPLAVATMMPGDDADAKKVQPEKPLPVVAVTPAVIAPHQSVVHGFGEAQAHYVTRLSAEVEGQVVWVSEQLERGASVRKDDLLVRIEDTPYREAVSSAQAQVSQSKLALLQEEREAQQARNDWARSGLEGQPDSPLLLREPQLEAARQALTQAEAALASAQLRLARAEIKAPFDGVIETRQIAPGDYLQPGVEIASIFGRDRVEIAVSLPVEQWQLLPDLPKMMTGDYHVNLKAKDGSGQWQGRVLRADWQLDRQNRQRTVIVAVDRPLDLQPALLPGTFVAASFPGQQQESLMAVPASALSRGGKLWYVTASQTLARWEAAPVFQDEGTLYVTPPEGMKQVELVVRPLASYLPGMQVKTKEEPQRDGSEVAHANN